MFHIVTKYLHALHTGRIQRFRRQFGGRYPEHRDCSRKPLLRVHSRQRVKLPRSYGLTALKRSRNFSFPIRVACGRDGLSPCTIRRQVVKLSTAIAVYTLCRVRAASSARARYSRSTRQCSWVNLNMYLDLYFVAFDIFCVPKPYAGKGIPDLKLLVVGSRYQILEMKHSTQTVNGRAQLPMTVIRGLGRICGGRL